ncbi:DedA family protein/thiosulfate sulfurtransferase GlpE [Solimonas marina]|uniref:Rhodanese domain-containing protein n=1 Tax=Solimonas marina TaxID=2714601 RepID=A0A970B780_9GAMM|nr:DedA family protein/thiosulfate sulfurtransferase GlpE [Solimonas marina]NKF23603.1 hypothetical protein [Solimonas marina]
MFETWDPQLLSSLLACACMSAAALGLPVPTLPALIYAGSMAALSPHAHAGFAALAFSGAVAGGMLGDSLWYYAGRRHGFRVLRLLCRLSLSQDSCVRQTETFFARRGIRILLVARFVPGLSVVSVPMSGVAAVPFARFALHDILGVVLWVAAGLCIGYAFAGQVDAVLGLLQRFGLGIGAAVMTVLVIFVGFRAWRRRRLLQALEMSRISVDELYDLMAAGTTPIVIDARSAEGQQQDPWRIPGARLIDLAQLEHAVGDLTRREQVVLYCACPNEVSAALVAQRLRSLGFNDVRPLLGGLDAWRGAGWDLEPIATVLRDDGTSEIGIAAHD